MGHNAKLFAVNHDGTKTELCHWRSKRGIHAAMAALAQLDDYYEGGCVWMDRDRDGECHYRIYGNYGVQKALDAAEEIMRVVDGLDGETLKDITRTAREALKDKSNLTGSFTYEASW